MRDEGHREAEHAAQVHGADLVVLDMRADEEGGLVPDVR
jgi:hypothetical protein